MVPKLFHAQAVGLIVCFLISSGLASPLHSKRFTNITISAPNGTQTHNDPKQICKPPKFFDYLAFYFGNYFAHIATVQTYPGESGWSTIKALTLALLFPASGTLRGLTAIIRCAIRQKTPLQKAARSGALCMVVRSAEWIPPPGCHVKGLMLGPRLVSRLVPLKGLVRWFQRAHNLPVELTEIVPEYSTDALETSNQIMIYQPPWQRELSGSWFFYDTKDEHVGSDRSIHGFYALSPGYALAHVPRDAVVGPIPTLTPVISKDLSSHEISTNYSFPKTFIAAVQLVFASYTLYDSFGSQIETYGYAAFGLTVTPYALMSLINLVGGLVTPSYPSVFIVHSSIMDEAIECGSHFDGVVGSLRESEIPRGGAASDFVEGVFVNDSQLRLHDTTPQSSLDDGNADGEPRGRNIDIQSQDRDTEAAGDSKAPLLFVPSSTCFERQKTHSYAGARKAEVDSRKGFLDGRKHQRHTVSRRGEDAAICVTLLVSALSFAVIGFMSGFKARESTQTQRVFSMLWVSVGIWFGSSMEIFIEVMREFHHGISLAMSYVVLYWLLLPELIFMSVQWIFERIPGAFSSRMVDGSKIAITYLQKGRQLLFTLMNCAVYCVPSVGGLIVVGIMMHEFGVCTKL